MCGIAGILEFSVDVQADPFVLRRMCDVMAHRGPDDQGAFVQGPIGLGIRRLSIVDLTTGHQPISNEDGTIWLVFNGEIYNHLALREQLIARGHRYRTHSDTETIVHLYEEYGRDCVQHLRGMFAFAIWDSKQKRLFVARDRLGIKPLYYAELPGRLRFASTLPALLAAGDIDTTIDPAALHHYMSWHAVVPAPMTIIKGVRKLAPATICIIEPDGKRREEVFWQLNVGPRAEDRGRTEDDWREAVRLSLGKAVERRRVADVPVGVLLSGGLDSSLLVALLAAQGQTGLKTFSVGFEKVGDVEGDEFRYSDLIAQRFATDHHRISVDSSRAIHALPGMVAAMSEPMMSHDAVGFYMLSQEVSKYVKVAQSGQGADEIFGGYHWYPALLRSNDATADYVRVYFDRDHDEMAQALAPALMNGDYSREFVDEFFRTCRSARPIDKTLQLDAQIMMIDDPVKRVDNMAMASGLETRVPFLDHELVELAARVPAELKVRDGGKYILKEASRGLVPDEVIDRPKGYFPVPALKYLRGEFLQFVRNVLDAPKARQRGVFNRAYIERLLSNPEGELTPKGHSKLWQVALLECWLQTQGI
jgi:asparagine synthase (glutamine-hydrolysing)